MNRRVSVRPAVRQDDARVWLRENGYGDIADRIEGVMVRWKSEGKRTRRNWWEILAGHKDGRPRVASGVEFPVLRAARIRQELDHVHNAISRHPDEAPPPIRSSPALDEKDEAKARQMTETVMGNSGTPSRPAEPRKFGDDHPLGRAVGRPSARRAGGALGSPSGGNRLDEVVDAETVLARVLENGEALAAHVLLRGRDPQVADGSHGLSTRRGVRYFYLKNAEYAIRPRLAMKSTEAAE